MLFMSLEKAKKIFIWPWYSDGPKRRWRKSEEMTDGFYLDKGTGKSNEYYSRTFSNDIERKTEA